MSGGRNEWVPEFEGQRPPFEPSNELAVTHGAYASVLLGPRANEIAGEVRVQLELHGLYSPSFELAIKRLGIVWARIERADAAITAFDEKGTATAQYSPGADAQFGLQRLRDDLKGWLRTADRIEETLGLTPASRAKLGLNVAQTARALNVTDLAAAARVADESDGRGS